MSALEAYDKSAETYDSLFTSRTSLSEDEVIYSLLQQQMKNSLFIDLGCGTAALLEHLNPKQYIGVDISRKMIKKAKQKFPKRAFILCDVAQLPFKNASADSAVSLWGVLNYADPQCIFETFRILKSKAHFFLMFMTSRYHGRKSYIFNRKNVNVPFNVFESLRHLIPEYACVHGFSFNDHRFDRLPKSLITLILKLETRLLGRFIPQHAYICIIHGEKNGK